MGNVSSGPDDEGCGGGAELAYDCGLGDGLILPTDGVRGCKGATVEEVAVRDVTRPCKPCWYGCDGCCCGIRCCDCDRG